MPDYNQADRPLKITTPLGPDLLLIYAFEGREEMSRLFTFEVSLLAEVTANLCFDLIIGQNKRHFNGIVKRFSQGRRDESFLHFRAEVVPKVWLLTKKVRSRIFQHLAIPDILKQVPAGCDVSYDLTGTYYPRDFCVQYREPDFDFASRLIEEEGIYYFFKHEDGNHQMVVSDSTSKHPPVPGPTSAIYEEVSGEERTVRRKASIALNRPAEISHARGSTGTPVSGYCSTAAARRPATLNHHDFLPLPDDSYLIHRQTFGRSPCVDSLGFCLTPRTDQAFLEHHEMRQNRVNIVASPLLLSGACASKRSR